MQKQTITKILADTAYVRTGGSAEEQECAAYLSAACEELGIKTKTEPFVVPMYRVTEARLWADGKEYPCKGYFNAGNGRVKAPLYYLANKDAGSLKKCKGKIVLVDGAVGYWLYRDLVQNGAVGFISYNGDMRCNNRDIDQKELRRLEEGDLRLPGVILNVADAVELVAKEYQTAEILLEQQTTTANSYNVVAELPGESDETVIFSAHYDSTSLSQGAYDNMSGCIGLLYVAEYFLHHPHRCGIRLLWCGSEERGLLGSKAYCEQHQEELSSAVLNINLDMLGCIMGRFAAFSTDEKTSHYIECVAAEEGVGVESKCAIRSSDSNSFAEAGVPAVSFARYAPSNTATIHDRYDTAAVMSEQRLLQDMQFITAFTNRLVNGAQFPLERQIAEKIKEDLDYYYCRKRR